MRRPSILRSLWLTALVLLAAGCADRGAQLLKQDYQAMNDDELLRYYYQLDEEVQACEHRVGGTSVGVGTGVGTGHFGLGVGVTRGLAGCDLDALRQRRGEVRFLLKKRGITP